MHLVILGEPAKQLVDDTLRIRPGAHADIIAFECADERLSHAVRLGTADWGRARDQSNAPGKGACVASGVAAAVVGEPFDWLGHAVHLSVAMLDGGDHQVLDVLGGDAARRRYVSHRLAVATNYREITHHPRPFCYKDRSIWRRRWLSDASTLSICEAKRRSRRHLHRHGSSEAAATPPGLSSADRLLLILPSLRAVDSHALHADHGRAPTGGHLPALSSASTVSASGGGKDSRAP